MNILIKYLFVIISFCIPFSIFGIQGLQIEEDEKLRPDKPNILFIAIDDLRPELGCYGKSYIISPNIDRLAQMGVVFEKAYASVPCCGPSRASLLSGIYPNARSNIFFRIRNGKGTDPWTSSQDEDLPGIVSLPMHFRNNGYYTVSLGKVYNNFEDGKGSWDEIWRPPTTTTAWDYQSPVGIEIFEELNKDRYNNLDIRNIAKIPKRGLPYESPDVNDETYADGKIASRAIEILQKLQNKSQPFFLAVGFKKPHLPFNAPLKYWNMYNGYDIKFPENNYFPLNAPDAARYNSGELRGFYGIPRDFPLPDTLAQNLIHGYYACVSYVDKQIGRVIDELEEIGLAKNTIIILWGDHGWFLLEHGLWSKYCNFEKATHSPLIIKVPWENAGIKSNELVGFIDIYPTLCDLAGLSKPIHLQGISFAQLFKNPDLSLREEVFCRAADGETIITKTHAYTEFINPETWETYARMLYDHRIDPEENVNVAELPENKELVQILQEKLHNHFKERGIIIL